MSYVRQNGQHQWTRKSNKSHGLGVFDNIHIDCVFGFEETNEGFIGYLSITCNYSKLVSIYPLKTKKAPEIAKNLINWISIYGAT